MKRESVCLCRCPECGENMPSRVNYFHECTICGYYWESQCEDGDDE